MLRVIFEIGMLIEVLGWGKSSTEISFDAQHFFQAVQERTATLFRLNQSLEISGTRIQI